MRIPIVFLIVLFSTAGMHSQNGTAVGPGSPKTESSLMTLDVAVFDSHGKAVTTLNRSDFELLEDRIPQPILSFSAAETPYNVLVLLDCRDNTRDRLLLLTEAFSRFANQLRPDDRVEIAAFGSEVHVLLEWTSRRTEEIRFTNKAICKSTDLYGALVWSLKEVRKVTGRRAVVVFSNGFQSAIARKEIEVNGNRVQRIVPPGKDADFQKIVKKAREGIASFHFISVDTDLNPGTGYAGTVEDMQQFRTRVEQLADASGGRVAFPRESSEVVPMFLKIGRELGSSYSLGYKPQRTASIYHSIDVHVRGENYQVQQSRKGYGASESLLR